MKKKIIISCKSLFPSLSYLHFDLFTSFFVQAPGIISVKTLCEVLKISYFKIFIEQSL